MSLEAVGRPMEVLLVEDSLVSARLTIGGLAQSGIDHRLTWCSDGQDARDFLQQSGKYARAPRPDLILLDLNLPQIDGRTLLKEIRQSEPLKEIPVIIMTGDAMEPAQDGCHADDVQGYLVKPIDISKFLELVETLKTYWKADMIVGKQS